MTTKTTTLQQHHDSKLTKLQTFITFINGFTKDSSELVIARSETDLYLMKEDGNGATLMAAGIDSALTKACDAAQQYLIID